MTNRRPSRISSCPCLVPISTTAKWLDVGTRIQLPPSFRTFLNSRDTRKLVFTATLFTNFYASTTAESVQKNTFFSISFISCPCRVPLFALSVLLSFCLFLRLLIKHPPSPLRLRALLPKSAPPFIPNFKQAS